MGTSMMAATLGMRMDSSYPTIRVKLTVICRFGWLNRGLACSI